MRAARLVAATFLLVLVLPAHASGRSATYCAPTSLFLPGANRVLYGDVDGDGTADTASTHARLTPDGSCRARLIVETERRLFRTKVSPLTGLLLVPPALAGLIRLRRVTGSTSP
jgi:hypothetical protein